MSPKLVTEPLPEPTPGATYYWTLCDTSYGPQITIWEKLDSVRWWQIGTHRHYRALRTRHWFPEFDPDPETYAREILRKAQEAAEAQATRQRLYTRTPQEFTP